MQDEQEEQERIQKMQQTFLADKELQQLEKAFKTKVMIQSIGEINV